jgi:hypothetical protein
MKSVQPKRDEKQPVDESIRLLRQAVNIAYNYLYRFRPEASEESLKSIDRLEKAFDTNHAAIRYFVCQAREHMQGNK